MEDNSMLQDASQVLKNLGGQEGMKFEVNISNNSLMKIGVIVAVVGVFIVVTNNVIKIT